MVQCYEMLSLYNEKMPQVKGFTDFMSNTRFTQYAFEILDCLFNAEKLNIHIKKRSDQLEIRPNLVKLLKAYSKQQEFSQATLFLGKVNQSKLEIFFENLQYFSQEYISWTFTWTATSSRISQITRNSSQLLLCSWQQNPKTLIILYLQ